MRSKARALHISPNHQYPTGLVTPIARRQALLRWAEDTGSTIIEDDYDSEFRYTGRPIPTLQSIDDRGRVIYLNTFSQTISPSMRLGFLVLPPRLLEQLPAGAGLLCLYGPCAGAARAGPFHRRGPLRAPPLPDAEGISGPPLPPAGRAPSGLQRAGQPCHLFRGGGRSALPAAAGHPPPRPRSWRRLTARGRRPPELSHGVRRRAGPPLRPHPGHQLRRPLPSPVCRRPSGCSTDVLLPLL